MKRWTKETYARYKKLKFELEKIKFYINQTEMQDCCYPCNADIETYNITKKFLIDLYRYTSINIPDISLQSGDRVDLYDDTCGNFVHMQVTEDSNIAFRIELKDGLFYDSYVYYDYVNRKLPQELLDIFTGRI